MPRPMGRIQPHYTLSISVPKRYQFILEWLDMIQKRTGQTRSQLILEALIDYFGEKN